MHGVYLFIENVLANFDSMKNKLRNGLALALVPQVILVKWLAGHPGWVETYYSNAIYPVISGFLRDLFGWVPFSVGEVVYTLLIILAARYLWLERHQIKANTWAFLRDVAMVLSVFYFTFHLLWGLNYYRQPLAEKMQINDNATYESIKGLSEKLITQTNALHVAITHNDTLKVEVPYTRHEIFEKTVAGYASSQNERPFLGYHRPSIKNSIYSLISSYMGIGGYLNPFTNEAQVNHRTPLFRFPVVSAHEIGHQIGYSAENETNFIGYLVTKDNKDLYFQYCAASYALAHCLNALAQTDEALAKAMYAQLNAGVKKNFDELKAYQAAYENPLEPIFEWVFNHFLKANNQPDGIQSYGKVVGLLVGYHEKYGHE